MGKLGGRKYRKQFLNKKEGEQEFRMAWRGWRATDGPGRDDTRTEGSITDASRYFGAKSLYNWGAVFKKNPGVHK